MSSVVQEWVSTLTLMQQSVLLAAIRGPDGIAKYSAAKNLLRWYRRCVLVSAFDQVVLDTPSDPRGGSFTGPSIEKRNGDVPWQEQMGANVDLYFTEFDALPGHYTKHFMMACEILGYKHPDAEIKAWWHGLYLRLVKDLHLNPETEQQLDYRLGDKREQWAKGAEAATMR